MEKLEFKGTKGEWVNTTGTFEVDLHMVVSNNGVICDIRQDLRFDEQKYNARLIASAPDLLEALQNMVFIFNRDLPESSIGQMACDKSIKAIEKALK